MKRCLKILTLLIVVVSVLCTTVSAMQYTNEYISAGGAYIHKWAAGDISVEYTVYGTGIMDTLGAHRVTVYRATGGTPNVAKDDLVATYWHEYTPGMMTTDEFVYSNSIRLQVEPGQRYYAVLVFYASLDGGGDNMFYCTKIVDA